jgi:hypothetical protein
MLGTIPPAAVVATGTGAAASLGDQRTDPPAWWRVAPRAAWGGTAPSRATRTALALADGTGPANFQDPRREGPRSVAKWSAPWKQSFCSSGQDRNGTVSRRGPGTAPSTAAVFHFAQPTTVSPPTWPGVAFALLLVTSTAVFQQAPLSEHASPTAPACSPPAKPQAPSAFAFRLRSVRSRRTRSANTPRGTARCATISP